MPTVQDAIALIKAGDPQGGRRLLVEVLAQDPANEAAWLWMSSVVEQDEQRQYCLEQVLKRNPGHRAARAGLANLQVSRAGEEALQSPDGPTELPPTAAEAWSAQQAETRDGVGDKASGPEATAFVQRAEEEMRPETAGRRRTILLLAGAVSLLIGGYMAYKSVSYLAASAAGMGGFPESPLSYVLSTPQLALRVVTLVIAAAILAGSVWAIVRALLPPGDKSSLAPGVAGQAVEGTGGTDDFVGIHVSLDDQGAGSGRRRRGVR